MATAGRRAALLASLLLVAGLGGCLAATTEPARPAAASWLPPDVRWDTSGEFSRPLTRGTLEVLPAEVLTFASFDGVTLQSALWRPKVAEGVKVPVLLDVGPYWDDAIGTLNAWEEAFLIEGFVKNGYAYGRVAVRGTAGSGGCMELMGPSEQKDMDEIVTFYGTRPWSNGNVALLGGSYDGTTPWMAAMWGNPHLKTIVPLSGLTSVYDHGFRNGTSWLAGSVFHTHYWSFGFTTTSRGPADKVANAACPESIHGAHAGPSTSLTGAHEPPLYGEYWEVRDFRQRVKDNYRGSVFLVHGMQDWRVPPHMAFPFIQELQDNGTEVKVLVGQWWHDHPDRKGRGDHVRWDYAEMLLRWFDKHLKGRDVDTGPVVVVEDSAGDWRDEPTWPPMDAAWMTYHLGASGLSAEPTPAGERRLVGPADAAGIVGARAGVRAPVTEHRASLAVADRDLRLAGLPRLHATFVPTSPEGARIYAELLSVGGGTEQALAHAVMDLRYHAGGHERQALEAGEPVVARMEFFPVDAVVPAGHELVLRIVNGNGYSHQRTWSAPLGPLAPALGGIDNFQEHPTPLPVTLRWGEGASVLELPLIERDVGDGKYPGEP